MIRIVLPVCMSHYLRFSKIGQQMLLTCRKDRGEEEVDWRPIYAVPLMSQLGGESPLSRLSFSGKDTTHATFWAGSQDGQLLLVNLVQTEV